jgi:hypothetical protein
MTTEQLEALGWPLPPEHLREPGFEVEPAPEVVAWLRQMFIDEGAPMFNPRHSHLQKVDLVAMWTNVKYIEGGVQVVGQAEIINVNGKPWKRADQIDRLCTLHGNIPQARIWLDAPAWVERGFWRACSVGEHELGHYAHKVSKEGEKLYDEEHDDRPVLCQQAHDVEEHVFIMERYGVNYCAGQSREFVEAALKAPLFAPPSFETRAYACGCGKRV